MATSFSPARGRSTRAEACPHGSRLFGGSRVRSGSRYRKMSRHTVSVHAGLGPNDPSGGPAEGPAHGWR